MGDPVTSIVGFNKQSPSQPYIIGAISETLKDLGATDGGIPPSKPIARIRPSRLIDPCPCRKNNLAGSASGAHSAALLHDVHLYEPMMGSQDEHY